ncbi:amino acid adenylation domain-containing protein [Roseomonas xinghualingensis]|uniref:amino acid adenylation domain-containing protein n=1 Tax=Roseomonas xinghualingensis TaxID=2986475 RepID=UPI0021F1976C|nr:amino acid adenylation domain-containing protein [Roseomonas sp. SXEYE001]MCV4207171.1 amino acid adenylation domain-containing protein [Roseomonas sp. SXEYE001]
MADSVDVAPELPLTEAQEGLWYAQRLDPGNPVFNTGQYIEFRGPLDVAAFREAVNGAVTEADSLALRIRPVPGGAVQRLDPTLRPWLDVVDLSAEPDPLIAARAAMARDMAQPMDPACGGLATERLYRLSPDHHLWYQRAHHLVLDGYGTELIVRRVASLYNAGLTGADPGQPLAPFGAAVEEDATYRASPRRKADAAYWRKLMASAPDITGIAEGAALGAAMTARTAHRAHAAIDAATGEALRHTAAMHDLAWPDLLTILLGAYCRRLTGEAEAIIGVTFMNRFGSAAARTPSTLMNVLPLRVRMDEEAPLHEAVEEAVTQLARMRRHGRYRGEQLRRDLGRLGAGRRLHGAIVNIQPFHEIPSFPGLTAKLHLLGTGPVDDITFDLRTDPGAATLRLDVEANPNLYSAEEAAAHAMRAAHFVSAALATGRFAAVPTATPAEAQRLVEAVNDTAHPVPDTTLAALIGAEMAARPDATAIRFEGRSLSYRVLDERSAALAAVLAGRHIGTGDLVAVSLERSPELVIALLGIMRAGAAYLPLDPAHPEDRLARILASAKPRLALAQVALPGEVEILPPSSWPSRGSAPVGPRPEDAAYAIYTSGSTGEPKGAVITHRAIVNRLKWMRQHYGFAAKDRILQKTPATFDVSVWEFFLPLLAGATLVLAPPGAHRDPAAIARLIREEGITTAHFVPSMLAAFLAHPDARGLAMARVFCSGEELTPDLRDRFHAMMKAELHNLYGPTEAAVDVSYWDASEGDRSRPVPIGRPVWNTRLYVLDDALRPVPPGVTGHLFIAGTQLAREYLGRPDLTARAFIPDPFRPGERMYRTGDLARFRNDGAILYLGRSDGQVKLRGFRIELGEIEAAIASSPMVCQNRVVAREDRPGDKRLVAYLVPAPGYDAAALRAHVAARVPDYMVPVAFVALDALPVNTSGKLDRAALPAPEMGQGRGRSPETETERRLAALFAEVLDLPEVSAEEDFFGLGGHSLLALDLMLRVRESFGRDPGLGALFENPTVARLATLIDAAALPPSDNGLCPLISLARGEESRAPLFVVHPAGGLAWNYGNLARALSPERGVLGLQAPSLDADAPPPASLDALAADYADRVIAAGHPGPIHLAGWSVGGIIAHAMAVRLRELGHAVGALALLDSYPADAWRAEPEPDAATIYRALLTIAGHDPAQCPDLPMERGAVMAFLRQGGTPLGRLPEAVLDGVVRVVEGNNRLIRGHRHRRFDGTVTHFRAAHDHAGRALSPAMWAPYAAGLEVVDVPALHGEMMSGVATGVIAPALRRLMASHPGSAGHLVSLS